MAPDGAPSIEVARSATDTDRVKMMVEMSNLDRKTCVKLLNDFRATGTIDLEDTGLRGAGSDAYPRDRLPAEAGDDVLAHVRELLGDASQPAWVTRDYLRDYLWDSYGVRPSMRSMSKLLVDWGLAWAELKRPPAGVLTDVRYNLLRRCVMKFDNAVHNGDKLVFFDQSYANCRLSKSFGLAPVGEAYSATAPTAGGGLGQRICWVHAVNEDGLLGGLDDMPKAGDIVTEHANAFMVFMAKKGGHDGDYHGNFTWDIFEAWFKLRLFPALDAEYAFLKDKTSTKRVVIVTDNAAYHTRFSEDDEHFLPKHLSRAQLIERMSAVGCVSLSVTHSFEVDGELRTLEFNVGMNDKDFPKRAAAGKTPYLAEIRAACMRWLAYERPRTLDNDFERAVFAKYGERVCVLWLAPNLPEGNASELVWARGKGYAAANYVPGRTPTTLVDDVKDGMFTDKRAGNKFLNATGGHFIKDADGKCATAAALVRHILFSTDPKHPGLGVVIAKTPGLNERLENKIGDLMASDSMRDDALRFYSRECTRFRVKEEAADEMGAEAALEEEDAEDDDGEESE
jgi:hypothetical protein